MFNLINECFFFCEIIFMYFYGYFLFFFVFNEIKRFIYILIFYFLIMELNGIILFDMKIFCFFRFFWSKFKNLYLVFFKFLLKSKFVNLFLIRYFRERNYLMNCMVRW